ncbi:MAG: helix-turn-helix domain-containing protein [Oscillospiraceae bacterium]|nr:helix-turn-helix domain-containing protein [Oscillospiraceae bacterium]
MDREIESTIEKILSEFKRLTQLNCSFYPYSEKTHLRLEIDESNWLCRRIAANPDACKLCEKKRIKLMSGAMQTREPVFSECHGGIGEFVVPCYSRKKLLGIFVAYTVPAIEYAQNMLEQKDYYREQFGISGDELERYLKGIPALERHRMRPSMLLLHSLIRININSGFLPSVNIGKVPGFEEDPAEEEEPPEYPLSYMNIILEGEKGDNPYKLVESAAVQLTHRFYSYLHSGRMIQAKEQYHRLFRPALRDEEIYLVRFNTLTTFFRLITYLMKWAPDFRSIFEISVSIPERITAASATEEIVEILDEFLEVVITSYGEFDIRSPIVKRMVEYIENNYDKPITLEKLARSLHLSTSYASRLFKKYMGVNMKWYLNEVRMDYAYNYLKQTQIPIQEVAKKVGYVEIRSFYKMFKSHFGVTCSQIRNLYSSQKNIQGTE